MAAKFEVLEVNGGFCVAIAPHGEIVSEPFETAAEADQACAQFEAGERLVSAVKDQCSNWEIYEPWPGTPEEWLFRLTDEFGVTGYWDDGEEETVEFDEKQLEVQESDVGVDVLDADSLSAWGADDSGRLMNSHAKALVEELLALKAQSPDVSVVAHTIVVGMKYCGTIEYRLVRISKDGQSVDVHPLDVIWESKTDRTFGPMWESPDDA